jgi:hypothetical protein
LPRLFGSPAIAERGNPLHRRPAVDGYLGDNQAGSPVGLPSNELSPLFVAGFFIFTHSSILRIKWHL